MKTGLRLAFCLVPLSLLMSASSAPAQTVRYDANCKPITEEDKLAQLEIGQTHPIIGLGLKLNDKVCNGRNFLVRLFKKEADPDKIDAGDVLDASKPAAATSLPDGMTAQQWKEKQERWRWERDHPNWRAEEHAARLRNTNAANDESNFPEDQPSYLLIPPTKPDGFLTIFQAKTPPAAAPPAASSPTLSDVQGEGTLLSPTGIARGLFNRGKLQGRGEEVLADGTWRGGEYKDGKLNGDGFELRDENGQPVLTEGTFANDKPDGTVNRTYANGNMRKALWNNGQQIAEGALAAAGRIPPEPVYKSPEQLAAEADAEFDADLASVSSAAALYAMADEYSERGDDGKARRAYRSLMTRFPSSSLADRAAAKLDSLGSAATSSRSAGAISHAASLDGKGSAAGPYRTQIANPVLPQSFYSWLSGRSLPIDQCNALGNGERLTALMTELKPVSQQGTIGALRAVIVSTEAAIALFRQCEQSADAQQQIASFQAARAQAITNCQQLASDPRECLAAYPWNY